MQISLSQAIRPLIARIKKASKLPVAVGFGISNATQVKEVWQLADGAVVGSRLVAEIESYQREHHEQSARDELIARMGNLINELRG